MSTVTGTLVSVANEAMFAWVGWVAVRKSEPEYSGEVVDPKDLFISEDSSPYAPFYNGRANVFFNSPLLVVQE